MQAGDYAYVWSGGDLSGAVVAGASATAISFGKAGLALTAGRDALVAAVGDVDGMYSAARDLAVASYGRISILGQAGRDVPWLWARGDVEGTYLVGRHVGEVFSYGNVLFALMAGQSVSGVGSVGSLQAWGSLGGIVTAADSIDYLRVGDQVTAILSAASVATPIEYDTTIFLDYPYPGAPDNPMPGVLAGAAVQLAEIQAARAAKLVEIAGVKTAHLAKRASVAGKLAEARSEVYSQGEQELAEREKALEDGIDALKKDLARAQDEAQADEAEVRRLADAGLQVAKGEKAADERVGKEKYDKARAETAKADSDAAADKAELAKSREEELARFDKKREAALDWPEQYRAAVKEWLWQKVQERANKLLDPGAMALELAGISDGDVATAKLGWKQAMENGDSYASAIYQVVGIWGFNKIPGVMFLYQAFTGEDPVTLEKYNAGDRWLKGIIGGIELASFVIPAAKGLAALKGPCGASIFSRILKGTVCFTPGHWTLEVVFVPATMSSETAPTVATASAETPDDPRLAQTLLVGAGLVIAAGIVGEQAMKRRRRKKERTVDEVFAAWGQDSSDSESSTLPPDEDDIDWEALMGPVADLDRTWNAEEGETHGSAGEDAANHAVGTEQSIGLNNGGCAVLDPPHRTTRSARMTSFVSAPAETQSSLGSWWRNGCFLLALLLAIGAAAFWPRSQEKPIQVAAAAANQPAEPSLPDPSEFLDPEMQEALAAAGLKAQVRRTRIEDIEDDDFVLARNAETGQLEVRQVLKAFGNTAYHLRILEFKAADGSVQRIETTDEHPFRIPARNDFVNARDLQVGEQVVGPNDEVQTLTSTKREEHPEGVPVHNFEVEGLHNYFVQGPDGAGPAMLVHNARCGFDISTIAPDWSKKGFHVKVSGVEVALRPGERGSIVLKKVFSTTPDSAFRKAAKVVQEELVKPSVRQVVHREAVRARDYLRSLGDPLSVARSGELHFLIKALEKTGIE